MFVRCFGGSGEWRRELVKVSDERVALGKRNSKAEYTPRFCARLPLTGNFWKQDASRQRNRVPVMRISGRSAREMFCGVCGDFLQITPSRHASAFPPLPGERGPGTGRWGGGRAETQLW